MWYIHKMEYYSAIKVNVIFVICSKMEGPTRYYTKWSKSENNIYLMVSLICGTEKSQKNKTEADS